MDKVLVAYEKLHSAMPPIGFFNRNKRVGAYLKISKMLQKMLDNQEISYDDGLYVLSVLARKCAPFQKSAMMAALNLEDIRQLLPAIGFKYANDFRCSLRLYPVDDNTPTP